MPNTIYINGRFLTQSLSGVQRYAFEISKQLSLFDKYDFIILVPSKSEIKHDYKFQLNIKKIGINTGHIWEQIDLPIYLKNKGNNLLINFTNSAPIFYTHKISTIHDLSVFENPSWFSFKYKSFYRFITPRIINTSKKILTVSQYCKNNIINTFNISPSTISVIHNGTSLVVQKRGKRKQNYILFIGGSSKRKNLKNLISAFIKLNHNDIKLKVVGEVVKHLSSDNLNPHINIEYLGSVSNDKLIDLYSNAQMLVFPSFYEGFGLPPLEAMSCSCPTIISNIPVLKELYKSSSIYINPYSVEDIKNMILKLLNDDELRNNLVKSGLSESRNYSWKKSASEIIDLIKDILK